MGDDVEGTAGFFLLTGADPADSVDKRQDFGGDGTRFTFLQSDDFFFFHRRRTEESLLLLLLLLPPPLL